MVKKCLKSKSAKRPAGEQDMKYLYKLLSFASLLGAGSSAIAHPHEVVSGGAASIFHPHLGIEHILAAVVIALVVATIVKLKS
jgi:hydrogenase/urease accessory protein HupE